MPSERLALILETVGVGGVVADFKKVSRSARDIETGTGIASKGLDKLSVASGMSAQALQTGIIAGAAVATTALINFGKSAVEAASGLNEQASATGVVFGSASDAVKQFAKDAGASMGLSEREALKATNAIGGMFTGLGATQDAAAGASMVLVQRAADIASMRDVAGGAAEVLEKLRSGLTGEVEPLRNLGIFLNESTVNAKAAAMGFESLNGKFDDGAKVAARYALILEQSKIAQGDFARTSNSFANQQRTFAAQWENFQARSGGLLEKGAATFLRGANQQLKMFSNLIGGSKDSAAAEKARMLQAQAAEEITLRQIQTAEQLAAAYQRMKDSVFGVVDAQRASAAAGRSLNDAQQSLADKQKTLNDLLKQGAVDAKEVERARRDLTQAEKDAAKAATDLTAAQDKLTKAEKALADLRTGVAAEKAASEAADDVTAANLRLRGANLRVTSAQTKLDEVMNDSTSTSEELAAAQLDLDQANFDLEQATKAASAAQDALNKAWRIGSENSPEMVAADQAVKDAKEDVAGATDAVAAATQNVKDKQDALGTALAGDPNYSDDVEKARRDVADATQAVADASRDVAVRANEAREKQDEFNKSLSAGTGHARALKAELDALVTSHPDLAPLFAPVIALLSEAIGSAMSQWRTNPGQVPTARLGPAVPALAGGGIVTEPMLAHIGEAGPEAVIPLSRAGASAGMGTTVVNVYASGLVGDTDRVAAEIHAALTRFANRGYSNPWKN